jgi:hypothetical protein
LMNGMHCLPLSLSEIQLRQEILKQHASIFRRPYAFIHQSRVNGC